MRVRVGFLQPFDRYMCIDLSRGKTGVAEQSLHTAQIGAAIEHVGSEAVPKFMGADRNWNRRVPQIAF